MMNTKDLVKFFAVNLTYEDVIRGDEYAKGYAEGWRDGRLTNRPQGKWIHDYHFGLELPEHMCSVCGEWEYSDSESNYCPNCGAKMKGVDNE